MGKRCAVNCQVICGSVMPFLLLTLATFTPYWILTENTNKGLFYESHHDSGTSLKVLDQPTLGLVLTSLILMFFNVIFCGITCLYFGPDEDGDVDNEFKRCRGCCCCGFYTFTCLSFVASILMLAAVCQVSTVFPTEPLGASFYLCVASFSLNILMFVIACCDGFCRRKHQQFIYHTLMEEIYQDAL